MQVIYTSHDMGESREPHTALWPYLGMIEGSWGCQEDRVQVSHLSPVSFSFTVSPWNPHGRFQDSLPSPFLAVKNTLVQCLVYPESMRLVHMYLPTCCLPSTSEEALFLTQLLVWPQGKRP